MSESKPPAYHIEQFFAYARKLLEAKDAAVRALAAK